MVLSLNSTSPGSVLFPTFFVTEPRFLSSLTSLTRTRTTLDDPTEIADYSNDNDSSSEDDSSDEDTSSDSS